MTPRLRLAVIDDAPAIADLSVRGWRAAYRGIVPDRVLDGLSVEQRATGWKAAIQRSAASPERVWILATPIGLIGFAAGGPARDESATPPAGAGEVYAIYLDPTALRRGHGRRLFAHAVADLVDRGFGPIVVWVFDANTPARRFYEAAGFRADGARATIDFGGEAVDEVRYRLDTVASPT